METIDRFFQPPKSSFFLFGPRGTGKSTFVHQVFKNGVYVAHCPALEGCYTQGDTYEEAMRNIKNVIQMCLEEFSFSLSSS